MVDRGAAALLLVGGAFWILFRRQPDVALATPAIPEQREHLEAEFFRAAAASGKPRGLRWSGCDWEDLLEFARDAVGRLTAIAGVTIRFEAIEGGDMEGLPRRRQPAQRFRGLCVRRPSLDRHGRVVFNLNPDEVLMRFRPAV